MSDCNTVSRQSAYIDGVNIKDPPKLNSSHAYNRQERLTISGLYLWLHLQFGVYCIVTKMTLFTRTWLLLIIAHLEDLELLLLQTQCSYCHGFMRK